MVLAVLSFVAFNFYATLMLRGDVSGENRKSLHEYNNGVMNNLKTVFGQRFYVAWIFPSIKSQLPEDGYSWKKQSDQKCIVND